MKSNYTPNYGIHENAVASIREEKFHITKKAYSTIKMMQSETGLIVDGSILASLEKQGFKFDLHRDNKSVYRPDNLWKPLSNYVHRPKLSIDGDVANQAWGLTLKAFGRRGAYLDPLRTFEELKASIDGAKASGAPFFGKKKDTFPSDYTLAQKTVNGKVRPQFCVAYHRVQHGSDGPKNRLVWGYPQSMTLVEARFARPLIDKFLEIRSPMAFGLHKQHLYSRLRPVENSGLRYSLDFSGFDASIAPELIARAFSILETWFETDQENQTYWDLIKRYFIHTPILMPDGYVYQKHKGVPSGSYFTQMIDSIVNYFALQYCFIRESGKALVERKVLVLGDDSAVGHDTHMPLVRVSQLMKELGLVINVEKSSISREGQYVEFLGHKWVDGLMDRDAHEVAMRMALPENYSKIENPDVRIVSRMLGYAADSQSAWRIIWNWSKFSCTNVQSLMHQLISQDLLPGYSKFVAQERQDDFVYNGTALCYMGLLR